MGILAQLEVLKRDHKTMDWLTGVCSAPQFSGNEASFLASPLFSSDVCFWATEGENGGRVGIGTIRKSFIHRFGSILDKDLRGAVIHGRLIAFNGRQVEKAPRCFYVVVQASER